MTDIQTQIKAAEQRKTAAEAEIARLNKELEWERSFVKSDSFLVLYRCIDTGRITSIKGSFADHATARRYALGLPGYGLDKDIFIEPVPFYS
jgi:hypothetical protein